METYDFDLDRCDWLDEVNAWSSGSARFAMNTYKIGKRCCDTCLILEN